MLKMPQRFSASLRDRQGHSLHAPKVLIAINLLLKGRYYYGNLIGLTDDRGIASITGSELRKRFDQDRANFPMDYKVDLDDCDSMVEILVLSGTEVADGRRAVGDNFSVTAEIRDSYDAAVNYRFAPASVRVSTESLQGDLVVAIVTDMLPE